MNNSAELLWELNEMKFIKSRGEGEMQILQT